MKPVYLFLLFFLIFSACDRFTTLRFVHFSDTHLADNSTGEEDLRLAVADVNGQSGIDFVLVTGDITDINTADHLATAKRILDSLNVPYFIIPGNHDTKWSGSAGANFRALWGSDRFAFDAGGFRFFGFHQGPVLRMDDGHIPREILNWLQDELQKAGTQQPLILVMHYPLTDAIDNWQECVDIIRDYDVRAIIHGHGHRSRLKSYQGIPGIMGRSTLRAGAPRGGYNIYELQGDTLRVSERISGGETANPWAAVAMDRRRKIDFIPDSLRHDMSVNTRFSNVTRNWIFSGGYMMTASPVYDARSVYIGDVSGSFYALDNNDGKVMWRYQAGDAIYGSAAMQDSFVVFTSADSSIYCLNASSGELRWQVPTFNALVAVPVIKGSTVYCGASDGIFRAIDLISGQTRWEYHGIGGYVETKPLLYNDQVIFGAWDEKLYALSQRSGQLSWTWQGEKKGPLYSPAACWPVAHDGKIFIAAPDRFLTAIDAASGETLWRDGRWKFRETVGVSHTNGLIFGRSMTDSVVAFDAKKNFTSVTWAEDFQYGYDIAPSMPLEKNGTLYWGTKNGLLIAADAYNGKLKWKHKYKNYLINTVAPLDEKSVLFSNIDGDVVLLSDTSPH